MYEKIAVLGAGSWGTALAILLANKNFQVEMWARRNEQVEEITKTGENVRYLPGVSIPGNLRVLNDLEEVIKGAGAIVLSVPAQSLRETLFKIKPMVSEKVLFINTAKGIEENSLLRLSQVFGEVFDEDQANRFAVLSGPSHAEEVGKDIPTTIVAAAAKRKIAETVQDIFMTPNFRVYTNPDIVGVELAGSLKNVIAMATGISDGLGFGDNTKAAIITRGLAEISRLGVSMGAQPPTFAGLAGVGDLVVTCTSMHSRNRRAGIEIGQGATTEEAIAKVKMVVEGITTAKAAYKLAQELNVELPIITVAYKVLFEKLNARNAVGQLMTRSKTHEMEEVAMQNYKEW